MKLILPPDQVERIPELLWSDGAAGMIEVGIDARGTTAKARLIVLKSAFHDHPVSVAADGAAVFRHCRIRGLGIPPRRGRVRAGLLISGTMNCSALMALAPVPGERSSRTRRRLMPRFTNASDAVSFALLFQHACAHFAHGSQRQLQVRIGLHLGEVSEMDLMPGGQPEARRPGGRTLPPA